MKRLDNLKDIPVIMMSSDGEMEIVAICMEEGAADYIIKPIRYLIKYYFLYGYNQNLRNFYLYKIIFYKNVKSLKNKIFY